MTEIRYYICDLCGAVQQLESSPTKHFSNYWRITRGEGMGITETTPEALCPRCGPKVFDYIKAENTKLKNLKSSEAERKENRVSTRRETGY